MGKFFSKIYKYTPLGIGDRAWNYLLGKGNHRFLDKTMSETSDGAILALIASGLVGAGITGLAGSASGAAGAAGTAGAAGAVGSAGAAGSNWLSYLLQTTSLLSSLSSQNHLTGNQEEQNEFSAEQEQISRDWQEQMYVEHQSIPAKVEEYQQAGLNPFALAGGTTGMTASSSGPQSAAQSPNQFADALNAILNYHNRSQEIELERELLPSKIKANEAIARLNNENANWVAPLAQSLIDERNSSIDLMQERINSEQVRQELDRANISVAEADAMLTFEKAVNQQIQNNYADEWQRANIDLLVAQQALYAAETAKNWEQVSEIKQSIELLRAQTTNVWLQAAEQAYAIPVAKEAAKRAGIETQMLEFQRDHQKGDLIWSRVQTGVNIVGDAAGVVYGFTRAGAAMRTANAASRRANTYQQSVSDRLNTGFNYGESYLP